MALSSKKTVKLWIWKAYSRCGKLISWVFGDRSQRTLKVLLDKLAPFHVLFYCADHYEAYKALIPSERLYQGKDKTFRIEQNNGQQRHWMASFRRKAITVTRSLKMLQLRMQLFAAVKINKTWVLPNLS